MQERLNIYKYQLQKLTRSHQAFIVIIIVLLLLLGVFVRINNLGNLPTDKAFMDQELSNVKPVVFNQQAIEQIKALNDSNVAVPTTQLPVNRQNPFSE